MTVVSCTGQDLRLNDSGYMYGTGSEVKLQWFHAWDRV